MHVLAVDDEPLALELLESYAEQLPGLTLSIAHTPIDAQGMIERHTFDGLFLDIRMPQMSGFELLSTLDTPPPVVVTSAYDSHALQSFSYNVVDYLLKPISFASFVQAVKKLSAHQASQSTAPNPSPANDRVFVQVDGVLRRVLHNEIHYVKASGVYVDITLVDGKSLLVRDTMAHCDELLGSSFIRIHKSYIVPIARLESVDGNMAMVEGVTLPIGRSYKDLLLAALHNNKLG